MCHLFVLHFQILFVDIESLERSCGNTFQISPWFKLWCRLLNRNEPRLRNNVGQGIMIRNSSFDYHCFLQQIMTLLLLFLTRT